MAKLTTEQTMLRAKSHEKKGEVDQAHQLYKMVLDSFPNNKRAQQALAALNQLKPVNIIKIANPPQNQLEELVALYNRGQLNSAVEKAHLLVSDFPASFLLWNILGAVNLGLRKLPEAEYDFKKATELNPNYAEAHNNMGNALKEQGKLEAATKAYQCALNINPNYAEACNNMGNALKDHGNLNAAIEQYQLALNINPNYAEAHNNMGIALIEKGNLDGAIKAYKRALKIKPNYAEAYSNIGNILLQRGEVDTAIEKYQHALKINPNYAKAYNNMGNALLKKGKFDDAIEAFQYALKIQPNFVEAHNNMGNVFKNQGNLDAAVEVYMRALKINPDYAETHYNLGNLLHQQGEFEKAIESYQNTLKIKPNLSEAHNNMGNTFFKQRKFDEANEAYQQALNIKPDYAEAYNNMGNVLLEQGKLDAAIEAYQSTLNIKSDYAEAYNNIGNALLLQDKLAAAIEAFQHTLKIKPDYAVAEAQMLHQLSHICDWTQDDFLNVPLVRLGITTGAVPPFTLLPSEDNGARQLLRSQIWATEHYKQAPLPLPLKPKLRPERLKVGYFSADFHDHATMFLMAGLLRNHEANEFILFAYSYGRNKSAGSRDKAESDVDHFFDVADLSDQGVADLCRSHCLDIAIDLKGYTQHTRSGIFKFRLAPVQINYLGYPGSMGASFIDYIIADPTVIPRSQRDHYSEKVIYLPYSYQPNDNMREISAKPTTREDFGLPEGAFVFCCFNQNYKISSREFDIWMRLLSKVEGSVLWLFKSNKWAEENLRREAEARGLDPARLIFADRLVQGEHLARHKHADLFLDTFNVNAHTTASDALWAGLPMVTKQGEQFAARVAASLLNAVGLSELVTMTEADYEALILDLATDPNKLKTIKDRLASNHLTEPLFDTKGYTRNFETGLHKAYDLYFEGKEPQDVWVSGEP